MALLPAGRQPPPVVLDVPEPAYEFAAEIGMDPAELRRKNLIAKFDSPHTTSIGQTYDVGDFDGQHYLSMEFVDGADLYKLLRRASEKGIDMPVDIAAYIAKEMANGLDYAHRR